MRTIVLTTKTLIMIFLIIGATVGAAAAGAMIVWEKSQKVVVTPNNIDVVTDVANTTLAKGTSQTYTIKVTNNGSSDVDITLNWVISGDVGLVVTLVPAGTSLTQTIAAGDSYSYQVNVDAPSHSDTGTGTIVYTLTQS